MKKKIFFLVLTTSLFVLASCKKDQENCQSQGLATNTSPLTNTELRAGTFSWQKNITATIQEYKDRWLKAVVSESKTKSVLPFDVRVRIPDGYSFSDFSSADVYLNLEKIATMPSNLTGKYESFTLTGLDIKEPIFRTPLTPSSVLQYTIEFRGVTKKAMPPRDIDVQFSLRFCE